MARGGKIIRREELTHTVGVGDVVRHGVRHGRWECGVVDEDAPGHGRRRGGWGVVMSGVEGVWVVEGRPVPVVVRGRGAVGGHGRVRSLGVVRVGQP